MHRAILAGLLSLLLIAPVAGSAAEGGLWHLAQRWEDLTPEQRKRAAENYRKHKNRSAKERESVEKRYQRWRDMPANDRNRVKDEFRRKFRGESAPFD